MSNVNPKQFGIDIKFLDGSSFSIGDSEVLFSIQSISKVFLLTYTIKLIGDDVWQRVGVEPSGNPFKGTSINSFLPRNK